MTASATRTATYQGSKISYRVTGSGRPVMLVHGFAETGSLWDDQVKYLSRSYQCIVPDLPGSGASEALSDNSIEEMCEALHTIVHQEQLERVTMIGHSMGGYITLAFAENYYNHLEGFGLFHSTAFADSDEKKQVREKGIAFIMEHGAAAFLKTSSPNLFSEETRRSNPEMVSRFIAEQSNFSATSLVSYYRAMMARPDRTGVLRKSPFPVLFIMGEHDMAVPLSDSQAQCHLPGKSYIHLLRNSAHMGMLEESDTSNRILEQFLCSF